MDEKQKFRNVAQMLKPDELGLEPLIPLDPDEVEDFDDLLWSMSKTAFGGRRLGEALDVLQTMVEDPDCHVVGTFSGAMTVAKMGPLLCRMIDKGWLNTVISTGALMAHGFIESIGLKHYKYKPGEMSDPELCQAGLNRVYDTLESEFNFIEAEKVIYAVMEGLDPEEVFSSRTVCAAIGKYLHENVPGMGILKSAYEQSVPVYIPAFTDSELALDIASYMIKRKPEIGEQEVAAGSLPFHFNPFADLFDYTRRMVGAKRLGIFTIGGGVPRNWAQQMGPFVEMAKQTHPHLSWPYSRFQYGVRICPEPDHWGGLSGCTYQEGISWGKFAPPSQGGRFAEVLCDATIAWPILIKALQKRLGKSSAK
ncbi:MAG: deoxyhypusine synthase family protein [Desulfovermiculus sp.]